MSPLSFLDNFSFHSYSESTGCCSSRVLGTR
nr:MAG TPA: hypothetical protein [Caudoviricetes sp.]